MEFRKRKKKYPSNGEKRQVPVFCLWPLRSDNGWVWLETVTFNREYQGKWITSMYVRKNGEAHTYRGWLWNSGDYND